MIIDSLLSSTSPAVLLSTLTTGGQTNLNVPVLDFGPDANQGLLAKTYGAGWLVTLIGGASAGASTLSLRLVTSATANLASPEVLWTGAALALADTVKNQFFIPTPSSNKWKRFASFQGQAGTAVFTGGSIKIDFVADARNWRAYPAVDNR